MEKFEPSSRFGIENGVVRAKFRSLEPVKEVFETSSRFGIGNGVVQANVRCLESEIVTLELSSETWNRE